jgi:hypothetical protein
MIVQEYRDKKITHQQITQQDHNLVNVDNMKKTILLLMLLCTTITFAQETFVRKYISMIGTLNFVKGEIEPADATVVFNPEGLRKIVFYFGKGTTQTYYQIGGVTEGETNSGDKYQVIECLDERGNSTFLQLFDEVGCLRVIIKEGYKVEFYTY